MARFSASCAITGTVTSRVAPARATSPAMVADAVNGSAFVTDQTAFEAALAVLVADAASPTQAHVTTANDAYTTFKADFAAGGGPATADVVLSFNATAVVTRTMLRRAIERLLQAIEGSDALTP